MKSIRNIILYIEKQLKDAYAQKEAGIQQKLTESEIQRSMLEQQLKDPSRLHVKMETDLLDALDENIDEMKSRLEMKQSDFEKLAPTLSQAERDAMESEIREMEDALAKTQLRRDTEFGKAEELAQARQLSELQKDQLAANQRRITQLELDLKSKTDELANAPKPKPSCYARR